MTTILRDDPGPPFTDPLALFRAAVDRLNADDFLGAARCCDPVSLRAFQRQIVQQYDERPPQRKLTVDDMMRGAPDMPLEVAEYNLRQHEAAMARNSGVASQFPGFTDLEDVRNADPARVFAAYLLGRSHRYQLREYMERGELTEPDLIASLDMNADRERLMPLTHVDVSATLTRVLFTRVHEIQDPAPGSWEAQELAHEAARLAALPEDERALHEELRGHYELQSELCRRQPDGGWLVVASHEFLGSQGSMFIGVGPADDDPSAGDKADCGDPTS